jgi:hypothetical protein
VTDGQLVVERFVDDGADSRFVPDRPSDNECGRRCPCS